jgi:hypothetical protein
VISGEENEKYSKENRENLLLARIRTRARQKTTQSGQLQTQSEARLSSGEKTFRSARKRQLDRWQDAHPGSPRKAAQHLRKPKHQTRKRKAKA